jgi:nucleoside phosphorylase
MAGVTDRVELGDLVVIDPSWDWGSGKWISKEDEEKEQKNEKAKSLFLIDPYQFTLDTMIKKEVNLLADDQSYLFALRKSYGTSAPTRDLKIHIGAVASGASVLSDKATFNKIKDQHRKLLGVEMEAYALFTAAECASRPKPTAFCIKSVVDFGDSDKVDDYQDYGVFISSRFTKDVILRLFQ